MKFVKIEGMGKAVWINPHAVHWVRPFAAGVVIGFGPGNDGLSINGVDVLGVLAILEGIEA